MRNTLIAFIAISSALATSAHAHIDLLEPTARYTVAESGDNKACPCGKGTTNRLCSDPAQYSDPNRSNRITTLVAGSTVLVRWNEYVGHSGRYRVAFDPDGADLGDYNANILIDVPDPAGSAGNTGNGSMWELEVPLPNITCDNCTLQLIQVMNGNTTDPVLDPASQSTYYTCADIVLVAGDGDAGPIPGPDAGPGNDAGPDPDPNGGGCCQVHDATPPVLPVLLVLLALGWSARPRSRRAWLG